jgi:hypothetical protein
MKPSDNEADTKKFLQHSRELLDESADALDASTLSRLNRARQHALDARHKTRRTRFFFASANTGAVLAGFAVAAIVALLWIAVPPQLSPSPQLAQQYEDIDLLTSDADLELLEDMEFISWLVDEDPSMNTELNDAS